MTITKAVTEKSISLALSGRMDTVTSCELSKELEEVFKTDFKSLVLDLTNLVYVSSAGLRVLLVAQKKINALSAEMKITGVSETVKEVFELTGFTEIMSIE